MNLKLSIVLLIPRYPVYRPNIVSVFVLLHFLNFEIIIIWRFINKPTGVFVINIGLTLVMSHTFSIQNSSDYGGGGGVRSVYRLGGEMGKCHNT